jgi:hypothetical protein
MATFAKDKLSGSTDGQGIVISNTATAGNLIHTGPSNASQYHEIWIYAMHHGGTSSTSTKLTVEYGNANTFNNIELSLPSEAGLTLVIPGLLLQGNATTAPTIRAFANIANNLSVHGYVHTIT